MELDGKVAFISGGCEGIGECIANNLLENGVSVILYDLNKEKGEELQTALQGKYGESRVYFIPGSVTKEEDLAVAFKKAVEKFTTVDIMVNNAGIMNDEFWEAEIEINLKRMIKGTHEAMKHMSKQYGGKGGVIVNISSILGLVPFQLTPVYSTKKHAVTGYTRSSGYPNLFEKSGVRVFCLCPGLTETDLSTKGSFGELLANFLSKVPEMRKNDPSQKPEAVGMVFSQLLKEAPNGSIWVVEGGEQAFKLSIPNHTELTEERGYETRLASHHTDLEDVMLHFSLHMNKD